MGGAAAWQNVDQTTGRYPFILMSLTRFFLLPCIKLFYTSCTVCYSRDSIHHVFLVAPPFGLLELLLVFCGMMFLTFINDSADVFE